jgi:hypothetical protein
LPDLVVPNQTELHTLSPSDLHSLTLLNATLADFVSPDNARFDFDENNIASLGFSRANLSAPNTTGAVAFCRNNVRISG